jgi:hypothetical protein
VTTEEKQGLVYLWVGLLAIWLIAEFTSESGADFSTGVIAGVILTLIAILANHLEV